MAHRDGPSESASRPRMSALSLCRVGVDDTLCDVQYPDGRRITGKKKTHPPDFQMPCVCGYFFIMCCAEYKCIGCRMCQKLGTIVPRLNEAAGKPTGDDP